MIELRWETDIHASADEVFSLLAELREYDRWLPRSSSYHGTTSISDGPIGLGTTYVEEDPTGTRRGKVTGFVPPTSLKFEQPMTMKPSLLGEIAIAISYTLTAGSGSVHVVRVLQLTPRGAVKVIMPFAIRLFRAENERLMKALKAAAEAR